MDEKYTEFYKKYPDLFLETMFEVKLYPYQKILLRILLKNIK
jgi:hypothetical protein